MAASTAFNERPDRLEEACGVFGVFAPDEDVARMACFGLQALQHRGQESAGIAVGDGETVAVSKSLGLVTQAFDEATLAAMRGLVAVGHTRYSTSGSTTSLDAAQPHIPALDDARFALAHNGTLVNTDPCALASPRKASSCAGIPIPRSPQRRLGSSPGIRTICATASGAQWSFSRAPTPWCS